MKWKDVVDIDAWSRINGCISPVYKGAHWHNHHRRRQGCAQVWERFFWGKFGFQLKIRCGVDSAASSPMQWTKDGFALGVDRSLPEWPNYSMLEDKEGTSSENLRIFFLMAILFKKHIYQSTRNPSCLFDLPKYYRGPFPFILNWKRPSADNKWNWMFLQWCLELELESRL